MFALQPPSHLRAALSGCLSDIFMRNAGLTSANVDWHEKQILEPPKKNNLSKTLNKKTV